MHRFVGGASAVSAKDVAAALAYTSREGLNWRCGCLTLADDFGMAIVRLIEEEAPVALDGRAP
jgi:hypothetical protein